MICAWRHLDALPIHSGSRAFVHMRLHEGCSTARRRASSGWSDGRKDRCPVCDTLVRRIENRKVRRVRILSFGDARIHRPFELQRVWCLSYCAVQQENPPWLAEARFTPSALPLRRTTPSDSGDLGYRARVASGLAYRQGTRQETYVERMRRTRAFAASMTAASSPGVMRQIARRSTFRAELWRARRL